MAKPIHERLCLFHLKSPTSARGFTLLEVLVAVAIFSVIAVISYSTLDTYIDHRARLTTHYGKLEQLQRLFILLERDIQFTINRKVRNGNKFESAILGEDGDAFLTMTTALPDINAATGVALKRVQWQLEGSDLIRSQWDVLDQDSNSEPREQVISEDIDALEMGYYFYDANRGLDRRTSLDSNAFPDGIEIILSMRSGEEYRRVFSLASGAFNLQKKLGGGN